MNGADFAQANRVHSDNGRAEPSVSCGSHEPRQQAGTQRAVFGRVDEHRVPVERRRAMNTFSGGQLMRALRALCCAVALSACLAPGVRADEYTKQTFLTFSGPVQLPGMTLAA